MDEIAAQAGERKRGVVAVAAAAVVSGLLCSSYAAAPLALLPIQSVYGRSGRRAGAIAAALAAVAALAISAARLAAARVFDPIALLAGLSLPLILILALALANAGFWRTVPGTYRVLAVAAACAAALAPAVASMVRDKTFAVALEAAMDAAFAPLRAAQAAGEEGGYESSALAAAMSPQALAGTAMRVLSRSYAAMIAVAVGGCRWLGNRLSGPGSPGREDSPPLAAYRAPASLLWPFLAAWAALLAALFLEVREPAQAITWNLALLLSLAYAAQGIGIAASLLERWKAPRFLRVVVVASALVALLTPTVGLLVALGLPLLGVTEAWVPYRKPKGVGA